MSERKFWYYIRDNCPSISFYRVENKCDVGMPDVHFVTSYRTTGWIELKYIESEKRRVKISPEQVNWLTRYERLGGYAITLISVEGGKVFAVNATGAKALCAGSHLCDVKTDVFVPDYLPLALETFILRGALESHEKATKHFNPDYSV